MFAGILGYDLDDPLPDHFSLSRIRTRYGIDVFRRFFEAIVEQCQQAKLVWGKELYVDSTQVNVNADLDSLTPRFAVEARVAIREHLATLFASEEADREESPLFEAPGEDPSSAQPTPLSVRLSEAEHEKLTAAKQFFNLPFLILVPAFLSIFYGKIEEATRNGPWEHIFVQPELVCPFPFLQMVCDRPKPYF